jgi:UDP:flavonoid glycosyltransferase YjiC (YdhE family)
MARFLFTVWPFTGCVHPLIAVARELGARGHEIGFYTGRRYRALVEDRGFRFFPFHHLPETLVDELVCNPNGIGRNWTRPWNLRGQLRGFFLDSVPAQLEDIREILSSWVGDAVITDPAMIAPFFLLHELDRVPVALCSYAGGCMLSGPDVPPVGLGLPLPRHFGRKALNSMIGWGVDFFLRDIRTKANAMRRSHGLAPVKGPVVDLAANLPLYLLPSCAEYDYNRRDLPACVKYTGPLQWYPPSKTPQWLTELPGDKPLVHVTEGTLHYQEPFVLRAGAKGLGGLPMHVIMTTGDDRDPDQLGLAPLAANVRVERWVPHSDLLPRTDVMVTTAGGGTVMAALGDGVPMVLVPTEWDKAENARRVVEAGAGIIVPPSQCTAGNVRRAVETILGDDSYRRNARRLADIMATLGGPAKAAELIEEMAGVSTFRVEDSAQPAAK